MQEKQFRWSEKVWPLESGSESNMAENGKPFTEEILAEFVNNCEQTELDVCRTCDYYVNIHLSYINRIFNVVFWQYYRAWQLPKPMLNSLQFIFFKMTCKFIFKCRMQNSPSHLFYWHAGSYTLLHLWKQFAWSSGNSSYFFLYFNFRSNAKFLWKRIPEDVKMVRTGWNSAFLQLIIWSL